MKPHLRSDPEGGFAALETVLLAPVVLLLLAVFVLFGRTAAVTNSLEGAAYSAARAASLERSPSAARAAAVSTARASLEAAGYPCTPTVTLDASGFAAAVGAPAQVSVQVSCTVAYSDLSIPGAPGSRTMTASAVSALDTFRERT